MSLIWPPPPLLDHFRRKPSNIERRMRTTEKGHKTKKAFLRWRSSSRITSVFIMAMGRPLRVYHNLPNVGPTQPYSLIVEQRNRNEILLVENYAIVPLGNKKCFQITIIWQSVEVILCLFAHYVPYFLGANEHEGLKKQYVKHTDAHGCLGILRINDGNNQRY